MPTTSPQFGIRNTAAAVFYHLRLRRLACCLTGHSFYPSFRRASVCLCCGRIKGTKSYRGW